jgi:hypothetical protein
MAVNTIASSASASTSFLPGNCLTTNFYSSKCCLKTFLWVKVKVMLWPTVSRSVCLGVTHHLAPKTRFLLLWDICGFVDVGCPLWWGDGSVINNCCWSSSVQSFSNLIPPTWRAWSLYLYHQAQGVPVIPPNTGFPFRHLLRVIWYCSWLRHYAASQKATGSIPDEVIGIFKWPNPSSPTIALWSTQPLTEMSTRNLPGE